MAKYFFSNYFLDVDERRLLRDNEELRLRGKLFDTLRVLVENAGKLVRKDAFMAAVRSAAQPDGTACIQGIALRQRSLATPTP
jgi:DNA-binding winged helix-turn-helix (wHTH) protein